MAKIKLEIRHFSAIHDIIAIKITNTREKPTDRYFHNCNQIYLDLYLKIYRRIE